MERIYERGLKFPLNEFLEKSTLLSVETKRLRRIVYEIFKTLSNLNSVFMKDIFHNSPNVTHKKHDLYIHTQNITKFGNKSLRGVSQSRTVSKNGFKFSVYFLLVF